MKILWWILGVVGAAVVAAFAWWTLSPFFITTTADEALPGVTQNEQEGQMSSEEPMQEPMPAAPRTLATASIVDTPAHPAEGTVRVVEADGTTYVRYENFKTLNGPDIFVYLSKDLEASEYVNLGRVKATEGNVNYEIPAGVDVADYPYVLIWCRAFGVLFNSAYIGAQ